jgi:hypothetical protein
MRLPIRNGATLISLTTLGQKTLSIKTLGINDYWHSTITIGITILSIMTLGKATIDN